MPEGLGGRQLAEKLVKEKPAFKVIFTSGYNMELSGRDGRLRENINFVQKPYRPNQLLDAVRAALNGATLKS
jgi:FixJ family two-component response regulator